MSNLDFNKLGSNLFYNNNNNRHADEIFDMILYMRKLV